MKKILFILAGILLVLLLVGCSNDGELTPDSPVTLTMWHVYGSQTESPLNDCIDEFNKTVGKDNGVVVNVVSVSSSSAIDEALTASANKTPGAPSLPDLFTAYPRMAEVIGYDNLLDWSEYLTDEDISGFVDTFVEEGYFGNKLLMLPIAKSTELTFLNKTLFDQLGVTAESLSSYEGIFSACRRYYAMTSGDFFQINDFYNYALTGMAAYGDSLIVEGSLNLDSETFEKIWYPMAKAGIYGGLCLGDGYASDRWKTGEIVCNVGSTAGILYLRDYVTYPDNSTLDIETAILPYPKFENGSPAVVHRGGGLFAMKQDDTKKNEAAVLFAKWLTEKENNLSFVTSSGYLPVKDDAFEYLFENVDTVENEKYRMLYNAVGDMYNDFTFCELPVYNGASSLQSSFEKNVKTVLRSAYVDYRTLMENEEDPIHTLDALAERALMELRELY